ncbi:MAG: TlyA family RNA methyltransferase [Ruminococcaceae bacterium]|nr:TlyA family RNA methyltransferase [Oscillospiraceae bacterium]
MAKIRLDVYLAENGLAPSRSAAQAMIMAGDVYVDNQKAMKAGETVKGTENIEVREKGPSYVSRGGLKLEKAMKVFPVTPSEKICMDIGASTGGFTDCMLQNGALKVYSVDVGYGQLAWKLRQDERVVNMERTNIRYIDKNLIEEPLGFFSVDVSFISLKPVLPVAYDLLEDGGEGVCLIKPQFEAGREKVGKKGVVREKSTHIEVIENVLAFTKEIGFSVKGLDFSPIKGPEGNIEYLMYIKKDDSVSAEFDIPTLVEASHELNSKNEN